MESKELHVVFFEARNKDNLSVDNFKHRSYSFVTTKFPDELMSKFERFVDEGVAGEMSRFYYSVNVVDTQKAKLALIHKLLDLDADEFYKVANLYTSMAGQSENLKTKRWLFDVDTDDTAIVYQILANIKKMSGDDNIFDVYPTVSNYGIITNHGFDVRELLAKYPVIDFERTNAIKLITYQTKE